MKQANDLALRGRNILEQHYRTRRAKNAAYSLRAFARDLRVSPGRLSEWMSGQRTFTPKMAEHVADRLGLTWEDRSRLMESSLASKRAAGARSKEIQRVLKALNLSPQSEDYVSVSAESSGQDARLEDEYQIVSQPEHFSIFALVQTRDFQGDPRWIARRLGISTLQARAAWERLIRLELVKEVKGGWAPAKPQITTSHDIPSAALRASHRASLEEAIQALDQVDISLRDITSITFPMNPERIAQAKELIRRFRRSMDRLMSDPAQGPHTEVYHFHSQLIPATRPQVVKKGKKS